MEISLELIAREISYLCPEAKVTYRHGTAAEKMKYFSFSLLSGAPFFCDGFIYVADTDYAISIEEQEKILASNCAVLFTGKISADIYDFPYIICENITAQHVFLLLHRVFEVFEHWRQGLYDAAQNGSIQKLLDLSASVFHATLYVFSNAMMKNYLVSGQSRQYYYDGDTIPLEMMNMHFNDEFSKKSMTLKKPFIFPSGIMNSDALCYNIFDGSEFSARLFCIDEITEREFLSSDFQLMDMLGSILQFTHECAPAETNSMSSDVSQLYADLISGAQVAKLRIDSVSARQGWSEADKLYVVYLYVNYYNNALGRNKNYYCSQISYLFPGAVPMVYDDNIVIIFRSTPKTPIENFLHEFVIFIREGNLRFGLSNSCSSIEQLHYYYLQARIAFTYGIKSDSTSWYYNFNDYAFSYIIGEGASTFPTELICAPEIMELAKYDNDNKSNYVETLRSYLKCNMNAVLTAKHMYIHHATMVYRLKRIQEITKIDFNDSDRRAYLYISFKLLGNSFSGDE